MPFQVGDGTGKGYAAKVNADNKLETIAITHPFLQHESEVFGNAYVWSSGTIDIDAGDTVLLVKNTASGLLHIDRIVINNGSLASEYVIHIPTTTVTTPTGTTVTGTNLNTDSGNVAEATAISDETTNTQGNVVENVFLPVDSRQSVDVRGLFLARNSSVAVDVVENTTESSVSIFGHYITYPNT